MSLFYKISISIAGFLVFLFFISLIKFYFYRKRQIDKAKIIKLITDSDEAASTYKIHDTLFKNKKITYVTNLLQELESENIVTEIKIGHSNKNNTLWEYNRD